MEMERKLKGQLMKNVITILLTVTLVFSFTACTRKAKVTQSWVDPTRPEYTANDILVLGISRNETGLKLWENVFVDQFIKMGIRAKASHKVIGNVPEPDRKFIEAAIKKAGASSVLITHIVNSKSKTYTHRGTVHSRPGGAYGDLHAYYGHAYRTVYTPPSDVTHTLVRLESNLYDAVTASLVWNAQSEVLNPNLLRTDYDRVVGVLIADMKKNGVVK
jgi:hypothetical protein